MKKIVAVAACALVLSGCNAGDRHAKWFSAPKEGRVNAKSYTPASSSWDSGTPSSTSCSGTGNNRVCTTTPGTPGHMNYYAEHWDLDIYADNGDHGWRTVDRYEYTKCQVGQRYPECTR